jgi:hypothetical protein
VRCEAFNSTFMAVCPLLLQLAAALSAHHECRIVLLCAQLLGAFSLASGVFLSLSLRVRVRWMRLLVTLTAVCAVLLPRTFWRRKGDFAARWGSAAR